MMNQYHELLRRVYEQGVGKDDRTGTGTISIFGDQLKFDLQEYFPIVDTKRVFFKGVVEELLWFLRGETNIQSLVDKGVHIWDEWADENGDLGPVYGKMWRCWPTSYEGFGIDQIQYMVDQLKNNPSSRRILVSAWNPSLLPKDGIAPKDNPKLGLQALAPCHTFFQAYSRNMTIPEMLLYCRKNHIPCEEELIVSTFADTSKFTASDYGIPDSVANKRILDLQIYIRSNDLFLGAPFNIASYALLVHMLAQVTGMIPGTLVYTLGDAHIYMNHLEQVQEQLRRFDARDGDTQRPIPQIVIDPNVSSIDDFTFESFSLVGYEPEAAIKAPVAV